MLRRKRRGTGAPTGCRTTGAGARSVTNSVAAGGGGSRGAARSTCRRSGSSRSAWAKSVPALARPAARFTPGRLAVPRSGPVRACGPRGAPTRASPSAPAPAIVLPGSVTVTCRRSAFFRAKLLMVHGARLMLPSSAISRPWFGSNGSWPGRRGGGVRAGLGRGERAGPGHVADVQLEVLDLVADRRVVLGALVVRVVRVEGRRSAGPTCAARRGTATRRRRSGP